MRNKLVINRAGTILDAFASGRLIGLLSDEDPALGEDEAYEIAREVHRRRVARGENPVGRKIGFTNRRIWPEYGVSAPIWAHVYDSTVQHASRGEARVDISALLQPRIEPEIQLHFAHEPPVTKSEKAILDSIDWIALGFEIVQCPYPDWKFMGVDTIAAFGVHGALVVGTPVLVASIDDCAARLRSFTVRLLRNGEPQATGSGANVLGSPLLAFGYLSEVLAKQSRFKPVQADEVVTTGTLTRLMPVTSGETWSATIDGIDLPGLSITVR